MNQQTPRSRITKPPGTFMAAEVAGEKSVLIRMYADQQLGT